MDPLQLFKNEPETVTIPAGETIFRTGDAGDSMYVIVEGQVQLRINERLVASLGPGEIFGEMALIEQQPRVATAEARTTCRLVSLPEKRFLYLVQNHPFFSLHVMRVLASRLRQADNELTT